MGMPGFVVDFMSTLHRTARHNGTILQISH
jgi:hypothetical protein